jgi:isoquinoline 1-oxidoreductase beta subunit
MSHPPFVHTDEPGATGYRGREIGRRRFVGYVLAGSTLIVAGRYVADPEQAAAADKLPVEGGGGASPIPSNDMPSDNYDFMDFMREQTRAVTPLLTLEVTPQGRIHFDMPRNEVGQGVEGGVAQIISDQLEMSYDQVDVTQSKARVDMFDAQLTGGSSSTYSLWEPLRELSELIRQKLIGAAAKTWDISPSKLRTRDGYVLGPRGKKMSYADAGSIAASAQNEFVGTMLNAAIGPPKRGVIGKSVPRKDIHAIVTGTKQFAMDLDIPGALPTMCARPPHFNGTVNKVNNMDAVKNMPGVTDVAVMNGTHRSQVVAVRANTFGQCIDAVRALDVDWAVGSTGGINTDQIFEKIASVALPMEPAPPGSEVFENSYKFHYRTSGPLEPNSAVADVKPDQAEIWAGSKIPARDGGRGTRPAARQGHPQRDLRRRFVRNPAARRPDHGSRAGVEGFRQAGASDVAPHRPAPVRSPAPRLDLPRAGDEGRQQRHQLHPVARFGLLRLHPQRRRRHLRPPDEEGPEPLLGQHLGDRLVLPDRHLGALQLRAHPQRADRGVRVRLPAHWAGS